MPLIPGPSTAATEALGPDDLVAVVIQGPDAAHFLQGQLSADVEKLASGSGTLAGLHNPQGRVLAVLRLARTGTEEFVVHLPHELADTVVRHLRRYVLRAKVRVEQSRTSPVPVDGLADIRQGLPQVYAVTSEMFVAQMLNLDLLGAIAFDKGCYTGQEIIARVHYRGAVKRHMQALRLEGPPPEPGTRLDSGEVVDAVAIPRGGSLALVVTSSG